MNGKAEVLGCVYITAQLTKAFVIKVTSLVGNILIVQMFALKIVVHFTESYLRNAITIPFIVIKTDLFLGELLK